MKFGSITTGIVSDGLVFNMDAANRASYPVQRTLATAESGSCYNTLDLSVSGSFISDPQFITQPVSASCWSLDGIDDYIDLGTNSSLNVGGSAFSISLWTKWAMSSGNAIPFLEIGSFTDKILVSTGFNQIGMIGFEAGTVWNYDAGSGLNDNTWHHICCTYNGSTSVIYVDSISEAFSGGSAANSGNNRIGNGNYGFFGGEIANIKIYNRSLSASDVLHNYNALKGRFA